MNKRRRWMAKQRRRRGGVRWCKSYDERRMALFDNDPSWWKEKWGL